MATTLLLLGSAIILLITLVIHRFQKRPHSYEPVPQVNKQESAEVNRQESLEPVKKYHHEPRESEIPLKPLEHPAIEAMLNMTDRDGEGEQQE